MPAVDLTGKRFGHLTVIGRHGSTKSKRAKWMCRCDCGKTVSRQSQYLRNKDRKTPRHCGCRHGNMKHGMTNSRIYRIWIGMRRRCLDSSDKDWKNYGQRGITVCPQWGDFQTFYRDMGEPPTRRHTLDRVDNSGPYSPKNCRWATPLEQSSNKRTNIHIITPKGEMTIAQAAVAFGIKRSTLYARLRRYGWEVEKALNL